MQQRSDRDRQQAAERRRQDRAQGWDPGDGPQGVSPGALRGHPPEGYDHQEQYERAQGLGHGRGGYAAPQGEGGPEAWGSLGGGYGEQQFGRAGSSNWNELGTRGTRPAGRGPRGYRRADERILEDVCEALARRDDLDCSDVVVKVENGEVTLSGEVDRREARRAVEDVAESIRGVEQVLNRIRVRREQRAA